VKRGGGFGDFEVRIITRDDVAIARGDVKLGQ